MSDKHKKIPAFTAGFRWILFGLLCGIAIGFIASLFGIAIVKVSNIRFEHPLLIWLLPAVGAGIVWLYRMAGDSVAGGTDLVIEAIRNKEPMPGRMAPLIFISTILTHFAGGSAGREGAALQMGGSLASSLGKVLKNIIGLKDSDHGTVVMCGMSAAFSALFGTPIAAVLFALEMCRFCMLVSCSIQH